MRIYWVIEERMDLRFIISMFERFYWRRETKGWREM